MIGCPGCTCSGVDPSKLVVVPEGINTTYYDPDRYSPMPLPQGDLVFGANVTDGAPKPFRC